MSAKLALDPGEIATLLSNTDRTAIFTAGYTAMVATKAIKVDDLREAMSMFEDLKTDDPLQALLTYRPPAPPTSDGVDPSDQLVRDYRDRQDRLNALVAMIAAARDIYLSTPQQPGVIDPNAWPPEKYATRENDLAKAVATWVREFGIIIWLDPGASPFIVALFRVISDLAGREGQPTLTLTLTYQPKAGAVQTLIIT